MGDTNIKLRARQVVKVPMQNDFSSCISSIGLSYDDGSVLGPYKERCLAPDGYDCYDAQMTYKEALHNEYFVCMAIREIEGDCIQVYGGGTLLHTLDNPNAYDTSAYDYFGSSVSISETYCIIGAYGEDDAGGIDSGKAYIFDNATGNLLHTLDNPNAYGTSDKDNFGVSVSISETYCIVGAYYEDDAGGLDSGKAYIFDNATGVLLCTRENPNAYDTSYNDQFGYSVSISETYCIASARYEDDADGLGSGKAYTYSLPQLPP